MTVAHAETIAHLDDIVIGQRESETFEKFDALYRTLCAMLYNYAPMSGHPGGSISSGRIVSSLLFGTMDYDISDPSREDADVLSYAAGHKALGLYSMYALRNEIVRIVDPDRLPAPKDQFRFEDLLGFRRNPIHDTPLFRLFESRALDGHPTPATPFVRLATGASGVGMASSIGYAAAMLDWFGKSAPFVHILEGEGGLTPGRVAEALAFASTAGLHNVVVHVDWNQSSIDSDRVTREGDQAGDYVQWDPAELFAMHRWNVISVEDGTAFQRIAAAQRAAVTMNNGQPTAIVYRTRKGWLYGIEGKASHGAGHKLCSPAFFEALSIPLTDLPSCEGGPTLCKDGSNLPILERCFWQSLSVLRRHIADNRESLALIAGRVASARERLDHADRDRRDFAPVVEDVYVIASKASQPPELDLKPQSKISLRAQLGKTIGHLNRFSGGAFLIGAADLLNSTSIADAAAEFDKGFYHSTRNPDSRMLSIGGICEDAMSGVLSGISSFGHHIGAGSSYAAFIAPLSHIAARLHAIGDQARGDRRPMIVVCGHAGLKTGEDGPTHADPQPLQLLQENFPPGAMITLTPWDPQEIWYLMTAALAARPSVIAPFVTRPVEPVLDREALGLAPASDSKKGVYKLRSARGASQGTIVLQESGVAYAFVTEALPLLDRDGIDVDVYYIASVELFDLSGAPSEIPEDAMGITGFTLPTMYRWIRSDLGREMTMHPFMHGHYPGSGQGPTVIAEAGLDGVSQYEQVKRYVERQRSIRSNWQ
jgi:transketolase